MNNKQPLTTKDSAVSFLIAYLLCQLGVVVSTCITLIIFKLGHFNMDMFDSFFNTAAGYLILSLPLYVVMLCVFFYFNKDKENKITSDFKLKKLLLYILIAIASFFCLYPIVVCFDSLLIKCGIKLSAIPYELTTKNYFISFLSLVIAPAICEELLFRGLIFKGLKNNGKVFAIILSSIMFSIFHMSISQTIYPLLMGLMIAVIMCYEQNIYYCIAVHMTNNFLSLTFSYFSINLIFNHWTYILLAIILLATFISIITKLIVKTRKNDNHEKLSRFHATYLVASLTIMFILWILMNII